MKKAILLGCILIAILVCAGFMLPANSQTGGEVDFLRIHIRANSNSTQDQNIKYLVKDEIVKTLNPLIKNAKTKDEAMEILNDNLDLIESTGKRVLIESGFSYGVRANLMVEDFPTRSYNGTTLPRGVYDALVLELGDGVGDNWWCVVYPPLCFIDSNATAGATPKYKSKIAEWFGR